MVRLLWYQLAAVAVITAGCTRGPTPRANRAPLAHLNVPSAGSLSAVSPPPITSNPRDTTPGAELYLPDWARRALLKHGFYRSYDIFQRLNPFYLSGHFDADTLIDVVVQVQEKASGKRGVVFVNSADSSVHLVAAGTPNGPDNLANVWFWEVAPRSTLPGQPVSAAEVVHLGRWPWDWSAVWWNGATYVWYDRPID